MQLNLIIGLERYIKTNNVYIGLCFTCNLCACPLDVVEWLESH